MMVKLNFECAFKCIWGSMSEKTMVKVCWTNMTKIFEFSFAIIAGCTDVRTIINIIVQNWWIRLPIYQMIKVNWGSVCLKMKSSLNS